jgi:hypothetical protein
MNSNDNTIFLNKHIDILPKYIREAYEWINPSTIKWQDQFISKVIFNATRELVYDNTYFDYETQYKIREEVKPLIEMYLMNNKQLYNELLDYFYNHTH